MIKILFVCHGNICRSPMAEFVMKDLVRKEGIGHEFIIDSAATSREEIGNDIHYGTKKKLREEGIPFTRRGAIQMTHKDYETYDYLIAMDHANVRNMERIAGSDSEHKIKLLLSYSGKDIDIADPWYTGNFEDTYQDVVEGCKAFLNSIRDRL